MTIERNRERLDAACARFDAWLDAGRPGGDESERAHAASCARCARELAAAAAIEALLEAETPAPAPAGFTERVMLRVGRAAEARARFRVPLPLDAMPWWSRAAMQPTVVLAAAIAALIVWRPDALERAGGMLAAAVAAAWSGFAAGAGPGVARALGARGGSLTGDPLLTFALMAAIATVLALAALPLYRWTERATGHVPRPRAVIR